jgi:tetratricopeptide (TPR) repeat protein
MPYNLKIPGHYKERELWAIEALAKLVPPGGIVVEFSSYLGLSSYTWAKSVDSSVTVYCLQPGLKNTGETEVLKQQDRVNEGLYTCENFIKNCPNIIPIKGCRPQDFLNWKKQIDVYFHGWHHQDSIFNENITFWSQWVKPGGIICGYGDEENFSDVITKVNQISQSYQIKPVFVEKIWCFPTDGNIGKLNKFANINQIDGYKYQWGFKEYPTLVNPGDLLKLSGKLQNCSGRDWQIFVDEIEIIKIGVKIYEGKQKERKLEPRYSLKVDNLTDGETVEFDFVLDTREVSQGKIRLEFDLVAESWYWFKDKGAQSKNIEVNVLPRTAGNLLKIANQLQRIGKLAAAIAEYRRSIELNPNYAWSYYNLANTLAKQGHLAEAVAEYRKAVKLNPNSLCFHAALAKALYKKLCFFYSVSLPFSQFEDILFQSNDEKREMNLSYQKVMKTRPKLLQKDLDKETLIQIEKNVIVAGIPRSGTTMIFRALAGFYPGDTTPRNYSGSVKKTHGLAPKQLPKGYKVIFVFGNIINSVISTKKSRYDQVHFINCGCSQNPENTDIYLEDSLNYEAMFDSWNKNNGYPVICVRYETIYENLKPISRFLGITLSLPPQKKRTTKYSDCNEEELQKIKKTYKNLIDKVNNAPDVAIYY